jgi:DNA adenine methylase
MENNKAQTQFYSPLRYPGGKNCIFPFVSKLFYENDLIGINYAEPYAGGAGLALRLLAEGYVSKIFINDLDLSIYCFWKNVLERPEEFCEWIKKIEINVENWHKYREIQLNYKQANTFELGKSTFFLNRTNISGVIKGGIIGGMNQNGKYKIDARFNKSDLIERIMFISKLKSRIIISNFDGVMFIDKMNKKREEIFIYLDPPYVNKGAELYMNFYCEADHMKLSRHVHRLIKPWMVSYDNNDFIMNLYSNQRMIRYKLSQSASNRIGDELLVFAQKIHYFNSINFLKCPEVL